MAEKPVTTGSEQGHERTREMGDGLKSMASVMSKTTPYFTQGKIPSLKTIKFNQVAKVGIKPKAGVQTGVQIQFLFFEIR